MPVPELEFVARHEARDALHPPVEAVHIINPGQTEPTHVVGINDSQFQVAQMTQDAISLLIRAGEEGQSSRRLVDLYHEHVHQSSAVAAVERPRVVLGVIEGLQQEGNRQRDSASDSYRLMRGNGLGAVGFGMIAGLEGFDSVYNILRFAKAETMAEASMSSTNASVLGAMSGLGVTVLASRSLNSLFDGVSSSRLANRLLGAATILRENPEVQV